MKPKPTLSDEEVKRGITWWTLEGMASMGFFSITTSGFLTAYALMLGCNNLQIGVLAALPFLTQPLQILYIPLVEKLRWRKAIALSTWIPAQLFWIPIALIPIFLDVPSAGAVALLLSVIAIRGVFTAGMSCAWNSWIRDLLPQQTLGSMFARRQALATLVAMLFGLSAAVFVDYWKGNVSGDYEPYGYTYALMFGIIFLGLATPIFMSRVPEPTMQTLPGTKQPLLSSLSIPFKDKNFRHLLKFLFLWGIALNLATPFFAVYMLERLGLPISAVIGFSILSQTSNIIFLRVWGRLSDQFGMKAIISVCASLYLLVILGWTFTTMPEKYFLTIPLLIILHILAGVASAGVILGTGTIGMKLAPEGQATPYLAAASIATSLGAGLGPLLGGKFADFFSVRELSVNLTWIDPGHSIDLSAFNLTGFDFLFGIAFILGLITLNMLVALREEGEVRRDVVMDALYDPGRQFSRPMSSVPGFNFLAQFPYGYIRRVPLPGLDVAIGVTAYQVAETAKVATTAAIKSKKTTKAVTKSLQEGLSEIGRASAGVLPAHRFEIARQAMKGAIHAIEEVTEDIERLTYSAMAGVMNTLKSGHVDLRDAIKGASYGAVEGADEIGANPADSAAKAVEVARELAEQSGLSEEEAVALAIEGSLEAAKAIGPEAVSKVKSSLKDIDHE